MFSEYPSSVPNYNAFRLKVPQGALDETDKCYEVTAPAWLWRYMLGQMSQLSEVNVWQSEINDIRTSENAVDAYNTLQIEECQNCVDMTVSINQIGLVFAFVAGNMPSGAVPCVGQTLTIDTHPNLVQTAKDEGWVGFLPDDGANPDRYTLPDMRNRMIYGTASGAGVATLRDVGGAETHVLTEAEMPNHSHNIGWSLTDGSNSFSVRAGSSSISINGSVVRSSGLDAPHNNMPPYLRLIWCMFVEEVEYQSTYDYSVTADDCVLFANNNGEITEIVDIKACAVDAVVGNEQISKDNQLSGVGDIDCMYGAASKVVDYTFDTLINFLDGLAAQADQIAEFLKWFPVGPLVAALPMIESVLQVTVSVLQVWYGDPDNLAKVKCDLFCILLEQDDFKSLTTESVAAWQALYAPSPAIDEWSPLYYAITAIGYNRLAVIFGLGWDECNDDWKLCACVDTITLSVPGEKDTYSVSDGSLISGEKYKVSVSGLARRDTGGDRDDGWFAWNLGNPDVYNRIAIGSTNQGVRLKYPDGTTAHVNQLYVPDDRQLNGYLFEIVPNFTGTIRGIYQDSAYTDNGGDIVLTFTRAT